MESLSDATWDVVLSGTGLSQSLLALALSRSGRKVLHVDKNDYYGGAEAALSLQEVESWVKAVNDTSQASLFRNAIVTKHSSSNASKLGYPRAYSISLSPQLIYTRSNLLPALVSSKIYRQLEFLAVGSWWIYEGDTEHQAIHNSRSLPHELKQSRLSKIPGSRENVFQDKSLDLRSTRSLMKFLKLAADEEAHASILDEWGQESFPTFLTSQFKMPPQLQTALLALASSLDPPSKTLTLDALPRIHRHLTSIGLFGPGFGAVIPKWGGLAEVSQVACRAGAVGGGVYVLKKGVESIQHSDPCHEAQGEPLILNLQGGEQIKTHWIIGTNFDLPQEIPKASNYQIGSISRSATIISSNLSSLFPIPSEGAQAPAGAIIVLAGGSLPVPSSLPITEVPPIYLIVHSSDTGECPKGQCIIYAQISLPNPDGSSLLTLAIQNVLATLSEDPKPEILWSLHFTQHIPSPSLKPPDNNRSKSDSDTSNAPVFSPRDPQIIHLPCLSPDLALDDLVLQKVKSIWEKITGEDAGEGFMVFKDREGIGEEDGGEEDEL